MRNTFWTEQTETMRELLDRWTKGDKKIAKKWLLQFILYTYVSSLHFLVMWWHNLFCFQLVRNGKSKKKLGGKYLARTCVSTQDTVPIYFLERIIPFLAQFWHLSARDRDISNKKGWVKKVFCPIKGLFQLPKNVII